MGVENFLHEVITVDGRFSFFICWDLSPYLVNIKITVLSWCMIQGSPNKNKKGYR